MRAIDKKHHDRCQNIANGILPSFKELFKPGIVVFDNSGTINQDFYILTHSNLIICSVSTFCQNTIAASLDSSYGYAITFTQQNHFRNFRPKRIFFDTQIAPHNVSGSDAMLFKYKTEQGHYSKKYFLMSGEIKRKLSNDKIIEFIQTHRRVLG